MKKIIILTLVLFLVQTATAEILSNDDGTPEDSALAGTAGWEMAEWFYPPEYPCTLVAVMFYATNTNQFRWKVWDDDGPPGPPGEPLTVFASGYTIPGTAMDWWTINLPTPVIIPDGAFYIGWEELTPSYSNGFDMTDPDLNQAAFHYEFLGSWYWSLLSDPMLEMYGDLMIRAVVGQGLKVVEHGGIPEKLDINVYPNPFNSAVNISAPAGSEIGIYDLSGREIDRIASPEDIRNAVWTPDAFLPSGIYLVRVEHNDATSAKSVVYMK